MTGVVTAEPPTGVAARRSGWRRGLRAVVLTLCGLELTGVAALVVVRLADLDSGTVLAVPIAGLPYAALGTLMVVLPILLALRSRWLAVVALALLTVQLIWLVPRLKADARDISITAPTIRVATANTHRAHADPTALVELIRSEHLDVLAVQELTADGVRALDEAGIEALLPFHELHPEVDTSIYSRLPLTNGGLLDRPTTWPQTTAEITVGTRTIRLVAVHTYYPAGDPGRWTRDLDALRAEAGASGRDAIFLGDFNATLDHAPMRHLLDAGMVDTHDELGRGWAATWPEGGALPPLVQLDHVLHGYGLAALNASEHTVAGTDHRVVVAELALLG